MKFWPVADAILLLTEFPYRRPPWYVVALSLMVLATALWSTDPLAPVFFSVRIYLLWSVVYHAVRTRVYRWVVMGVAVNMVGIFIGDFSGDYRFSFQYENPELAGLAGMGVFVGYWPMAWIGGTVAGFAGSRAALVYMAGAALFTRNRYLVLAALMCGLFVFITRFVLPGDSVQDVYEYTVDQRSETIITPALEEIEVTDNRILRLPEYPFGLGYHSYNDRVGQTPHILPVLVLREMGAPAFALIAEIMLLACWRYRRHWKLIVPMIPYVLVTDSIWYFPSGHYFAGLFALAIYKGPITKDKEGRYVDYTYRNDRGGNVVEPGYFDRYKKDAGLYGTRNQPG